jgi:exopolysaccharide biosynthesis operon protein EpsL
MFRLRSLHGQYLSPLACVAALYCGNAAAALSDTIHPFVAIGYTYDDNLLRLPDEYTAISQRSDRATQAQAGVSVERPFGRQKLTGTAKVTRVTFDHFDQLNYNGKDFSADLAWQLGNRLSGNLGASYAQTLTPFSDMLTDQRNLRTTHRNYVSAAWQLHPRWRLRSSYTTNKFEYELPQQRVNNRDEDIIEFGGDYMAPSGSRVGLVARQWKADYTNPRRIGGFLVINNFKQKELKANIFWALSGVTQVQVLAGYAKRESEFFTTRDSSGLNGRASVRWAPLGKVKFSAEAWREFAAVESLVVSNSLNRGASLGATWDATAKIQATASLRRETRDFELLSTALVDATPPDRTRSAQVGLVYAPVLNSQISLTAFRESRDGSPLVGTNSYRAKGISVNASVQF